MICGKKQIKSLYCLFLRKFLLQSFRTLSNNTSGTFELHFRALSTDTRTVLKNAFRSVSEQFCGLFSNSSLTLLELFFDSSRATKQFLSLIASLKAFFFIYIFYCKKLIVEALVLRRLTWSANLVSAPSGAPHTGDQFSGFVRDESRLV